MAIFIESNRKTKLHPFFIVIKYIVYVIFLLGLQPSVKTSFVSLA